MFQIYGNRFSLRLRTHVAFAQAVCQCRMQKKWNSEEAADFATLKAKRPSDVLCYCLCSVLQRLKIEAVVWARSVFSRGGFAARRYIP
jgi:hypothetical protein